MSRYQDINHVTLTGQLAELSTPKTTGQGRAVIDAELMVRRSWFDRKANKRESRVTMVPVTAFGEPAELLAALPGGASVTIEGRLQEDRGAGGQNSEPRLKVIAAVVIPNQ